MATTTMTTPLKGPHNKWCHSGKLKQPNEAAAEVRKFIKSLASHDLGFNILPVDSHFD